MSSRLRKYFDYRIKYLYLRHSKYLSILHMNESDTPSQYRLLKAARRTTRAEVTLVTIVTIITLWSFYALYKLSIGGSDSILGSNVLSRPRGSIIGNQEQPPANIEVNEAPNYSSQNRASFKFGVSPTPYQEGSNDREDRKFQQEVENRFREQLIRDIFNKQRELYGDRLGSATLSKILWPTEMDLRRPLPPMWLSTKNKTHTSSPINKSLVMMRQIVDHDLAHKQSAGQVEGDNHLPAGRNTYGLPVRVDRITAVKNVDRDVGESISIDRTAVATPLPSADNESLIDHDTDSRPEESSDNDNVGDKDDPPGNQSDEDKDSENTSQRERPDTGDQRDSGESINEANKENSNDDAGEDSPEKVSDDLKSDPIDDVSLDRAKKASSSIDEEVDRMTQPSSGTILQHNDTNLDKQSLRALLEGAVQFDDSLGGSIVDPGHKKLPKPTEPGGLIAQFAAPGDDKPRMKKDVKQSNRGTKSPVATRKQRPGEREDPADLQIDHDHSTNIMSSASPGKTNQAHEAKRSNRLDYVDPRSKLNDSGHNTADIKRQGSKKRERRSLDRQHVFKEQSSQAAKLGIAVTRPRRPKRLHNLRRRTDVNDFDKDDDDDEQDEGDKKRNSFDKKEESENKSKVILKPEIDSIYENYTIPAASDISIQDLLAHKRLLDELDKSRLPPPHYWTGMQNNSDKIVSASVQPTASKPTLKGGDSSYDAIHSSQVESEVEDQTSKSGTKKGSKTSDSKAKSKSAESLKKGGAKSKKHNKEEQKYLKEKKFKGAKSGKKTAKGRGGKGGKKGTKYYKDKGFKKKGFKNIYVKNEFGQKKSYFDEFRDKDFKKKWKNFDDKYNYAQMKKWQSKDVKGAKKLKDEGEKSKDYDKSRYKKKYQSKQSSEASKKKKNYDEF